MDLHNYLGYIIVSVLTITSPGAAILLAINNSMKYDLKAVVFSSFENILGLFLLSLIAMFGVEVLIKTSEMFFLILKVIGAVYLIYLGVKHMTSRHKEFHLSQSNEHIRNYNPKKVFIKGFLIAATNPKPILFFTEFFHYFYHRIIRLFCSFL
ncbi:LysE family translocator [Caminibacter sp.]